MLQEAHTKPSADRADAHWISLALWVLATVSGLAHLAAVMLHLPQAVGGAMVSTSLFLFGLLHGAATYGWRGILIFIAVCLGVSNAFENMSILSGFPFGSYHYSDAMGPRLFLVPVLIGPTYFGVGYLSWTLARAILGDDSGRLRGGLVVAVPIVASFVMVSWDLTIDPMMSTVTRNWVWHGGGSYFGVPFANFLGWFLTVSTFYQAFALYAHRLGGRRLVLEGSYWPTPLLAYASIVVAPTLSLLVERHATAEITDRASAVWRFDDMQAVTALVGLFTVLPIWVLAILRSVVRVGDW